LCFTLAEIVTKTRRLFKMS